MSSPDNELVTKSEILTNSNRDRLRCSEEVATTFEIGFAACPDPQIPESLIWLNLRYRGRRLFVLLASRCSAQAARQKDKERTGTVGRPCNTPNTRRQTTVGDGKPESEGKRKKEKGKSGQGGRERIYTSTRSRIDTFKKITRAAMGECFLLIRTFLQGGGGFIFLNWG